jgi:hypothetical protein
MSYFLVQFGLIKNVSGGRQIVWKRLLPGNDIPSGIFLLEVFERFRGSLYEFIHMNSYII